MNNYNDINSKTFGEATINLFLRLSRNPIGIIGLFIFLVYSLASFVIVQGGSHLKQVHITILVWFMVLFPNVVLLVFWNLVSKHHRKLYGPYDYQDESNFMQILESRLEESGSALRKSIVSKVKVGDILNPKYEEEEETEAPEDIILELARIKDLNKEGF